MTYLIIFFVLSIITSSAAGFQFQSDLSIRVITHNIRYATKSPSAGEKPWSERKHLILNELHYHTRHNAEAFICLQEALNEQVTDILGGLNQHSSAPELSHTEEQQPGQYRIAEAPAKPLSDEWAYIGVGRNDGKQAGEYSPIVYRPAIWQLQDWKTMWLSETPDVPGSKSWDAAQTRIVTMGHFAHLETGRWVTAMCTHWDDQGIVAREESAKIILAELDKLKGKDTRGQKRTFFLAGDLNSPADEEGYRILNGANSSLRDVTMMAPKWRYGDSSTFTGFQDDDLKVIDFIFVGPRQAEGGQWVIQGYSVLPNVFEDGIRGSDHRTVVADLQLPPMA